MNQIHLIETGGVRLLVELLEDSRRESVEGDTMHVEVDYRTRGIVVTDDQYASLGADARTSIEQACIKVIREIDYVEGRYRL